MANLKNLETFLNPPWPHLVIITISILSNSAKMFKRLKALPEISLNLLRPATNGCVANNWKISYFLQCSEPFCTRS